MPIIIWGWRGLTSNLDAGEFFCPQCDAREEYQRQQQRPWFTIFFIPIFPIGGATRFVQCRGCSQAFTEEVLEYEPPSEGERLLGQFYRELKGGTSVEVIEERLSQHGMDDDQVKEVLEKMCGGAARECNCGQHFHPDVRRCNSCGARL